MQQNVRMGALWFVVSLALSVLNDSLTKFLGVTSVSPLTIAFWRFLFSTVTLLPVIFYFGFKSISTKKILIHMARGGLLAVAIMIWCYGLKFVPIATATLMSFTIPLFTLGLAYIFLGEKVNPSIILSILVGFAGAIVILSPSGVEISSVSMLFVLASLLFALLDVINKKLLTEGEGTLSMMFYSNLFSTLFAMAINPQRLEVIDLSTNDWGLLLMLGMGANLILFFIIKAFSLAPASTLAPIRYIEVLLSSLVGWFFFAEQPSINLVLGGVLILAASLLADRTKNLKVAKE